MGGTAPSRSGDRRRGSVRPRHAGRAYPRRTSMRRGTRGLILAAGRGSRLGRLTSRRPKALVPLAGKPLIAHQLDSFREAGVHPVAVVSGYLGGQLRDLGVDLFENPEWSRTQMVRSLACAAPWLREGPTVISYGDVICAPSVLRRLAECEEEIAVACDLEWRRLWEARFDDPLADAETFRFAPDGSVAEIGHRPRRIAEIEAQYMGLFRLTPEGWRRIEQRLARWGRRETDGLDVTTLLDRLIEDDVRVAAVPVRGGWIEVDRPGDLELYERWIREGKSFLSACTRR
ncbi:MAG: phosphocholine cytidylyltransferase family protein [Acidobacteria bacterium]|nr:MAG: phosphocholine cytidylyltransferase family protein [Acidobacteriota bacterium]